MFSVVKDFKSMLGDVRYDSVTGDIISAGVTTFNLYGRMNVTESHLNLRRRDSVLGNQVNGVTTMYSRILPI